MEDGNDWIGRDGVACKDVDDGNDWIGRDGVVLRDGVVRR